MHEFHPTFKVLFDKLSNPKLAFAEVLNERLDWIKAGCPVLAKDEKDPPPRVSTYWTISDITNGNRH